MDHTTFRTALWQHEDAWRRTLPGGKGRCTVGITCADETALQGPRGYADAYVQSVLDSGAEPRLICPSRGSVAEQMANVDALLVPGGQDVEPVFYGEKRRAGMATSWTYPEMDRFEIDCLKQAYTDKTPTLGICRGMQLMNVAGGGNLIQDIPMEHAPHVDVPVKHRTGYGPGHPIVTHPGTRIREALGDSVVMANSVHHQAIGNLSPLLHVSAVAIDATIEAVERKGVPSQHGVQFHPEQSRKWDERYQRLFDQLVTDGTSNRWSITRFVRTTAREVKAWMDDRTLVNPFDLPPPPPPEPAATEPEAPLDSPQPEAVQPEPETHPAAAPPERQAPAAEPPTQTHSIEQPLLLSLIRDTQEGTRKP